MDAECVASQADITAEIARIAAQYPGAADGAGPQPRLDYPPYRSTTLRHPKQALVAVDPEGVELWAPCFG
ncbi:MAG TPA: protocatechuate 3,4-dioxygenase subunit beta, partial [Mycobacterium sp.]|nr:protocatechuate 3,4-dioxygenase subunit beta [Mycobacterium sp.]